MKTFKQFLEEDAETIEEAIYQGKTVTLNSPFRSTDKKHKFYVYVKNEKGNVIKLGFGSPSMEIKRDNPARRKSFRARHKCDTDVGPKYKARYWSCKFWAGKSVSSLIKEGLSDTQGYRFKHTFKTEEIEVEDDDYNEVLKDVLSPVQIIRFKTDKDIPYVWYAKQDRHSDTYWHIAFGVDKGEGVKGETKLDITKTGTGDAMKVFATVIEITNTFVEFDDNYEITHLIFESEGDNRTDLYLKRLVPLIDNFTLNHVSKSGTNSTVELKRTN